MKTMLIILCVIFLLLLPTVIPIKAYIKYDSELEYFFKYLFLKFDFKKEKVKKTKGKKKQSKKDEKNKKINIKDNIKKNGLVNTLADLFKIVSDAFLKLGSAVRHIVIKNLRFDISVSGEDAAAAAMKYGRVCAVFYPSLGFIENSVKKIKKQSGEINCLYDNSDSEIRFNICCYIRPIFLICPAVGFLINYVKIKIKRDGNKNER